MTFTILSRKHWVDNSSATAATRGLAHTVNEKQKRGSDALAVPNIGTYRSRISRVVDKLLDGRLCYIEAFLQITFFL